MPDLSMEQWTQLCERSGVAYTEAAAAQVLRQMEEAGVVLHFQERIYLQPQEIAESILDALKRDFPADQESANKLYGQLQELEQKKAEVEMRAHKRATWFLWCTAAAMFTQFSAFAWMTFTEPGWDVMEPVTFFWFYFTGLVCYVYFLVTRQEFTWENFREKLLAKELEKWASEKNLDLNEYERLAKRMQRHKHLLARLRG